MSDEKRSVGGKSIQLRFFLLFRLHSQVSVARSLMLVAKVKEDGDESIHVPLPGGFEPGGGSGHHLVLFAQEPQQGAIVGAATRPL